MPKSSSARLHAEVGEVGQHVAGALRVVEHQRLGDLEREHRRRQTVLLEQPGDVRGRAQVEQVLDGEVDRDVQVEAVDPPLGDLRQRRLEHVQGQRPHQRRVLGVRKERAGAAQAVHGVLPAHERLDAGDAAGREIDLRLVVQDQLVALERAAQLGDQGQPLARVAVAGRVVGLEAGARLLGLVHRDVGALQQRLGLGAVLRRERGADARVHDDLEPFDLERVLERDADPAPDIRRARQPGAGQQQRELVAAEPRDEPVRRPPPPAGAGPAGPEAGRRRGGRACR